MFFKTFNSNMMVIINSSDVVNLVALGTRFTAKHHWVVIRSRKQQ